MDASPPVFVVGTGRCGSTMLSELVREHEHVLSISELFSFVTDLGGRIAQAFPSQARSGTEFWQIVAAVLPKQSTMLRHGVAMPEVLYRPSATTRFTAEAGVPAIMQATLPHLDPDPDALFDELAAFMCARPQASAPEHYAAMFAWLTARFGKRVWVERSGGSLRVAQRLIAAFPEAKFLHLVRDGRACALSMSRHLGFRMAVLAMQLTEILGVDPYESSDRTWIDDLPDDLLGFLPEQFDADAFRSHRIPLPLFGHYWSGEIVQGLRELAELPADRVLTMRYEDFVEAPAAAITRVAELFGDAVRDDGWIYRVAGRVRRSSASFDGHDATELRALDDACAPGFAALGGLYER
jgi:putative sulfotransferase